MLLYVLLFREIVDGCTESGQIHDKVRPKLLRLKVDEGFENRHAGVREVHHACKLLIRKG